MIVKLGVSEIQVPLLTLAEALKDKTAGLFRCYMPGRKPCGFAMTVEIGDGTQIMINLNRDAAEITNPNWTFERLPAGTSITLTQE